MPIPRPVDSGLRFTVVPRYVLEVAATFEAAHALHSYRGVPESIHGHAWRVVARLEATSLNEEGLAYDFVPVRAALSELVGRLDHRHLNEMPPFDSISPSAEALAAWIHSELQSSLPDAPLVSVTVFEGPDCSVTYHPGANE